MVEAGRGGGGVFKLSVALEVSRVGELVMTQNDAAESADLKCTENGLKYEKRVNCSVCLLRYP